MPHFKLRPATEGDLALTYEITKNAMRSYVEKTWGAWDEEAQFEKHRQNYTPGTHQIVLVHNQPVGLVAVENEPAYLWLVKLYLISRFRGKGIGTELLLGLLAQAIQAGKRVRLRVLRVNTRAKAFYARHGFTVVGETPERFFMETSASGA